jgi:uncharacterized protein
MKLRSLRRLLPVALLLLLAACATPQPLPPPERPDIPFGEGRIWQIDFPGMEPSYLFGTIHVSDPRVLKLPEAAERAFASARIAAFEVKKERGEVELAERPEYYLLPEGESLSGLIGFWSYNRLKHLPTFRYFTLRDFDRVQPWIVWLIIADRDINVGLRSDPNKPVLDDWLQQRAIDEGKEVVGLETAEQQLDIFRGMPMEDQVSMLVSAIDEYYRPATEIDLLGLYLDGDLAMRYALWQRFLEHLDPEVARRFHNRIGPDRNRYMAERLPAVFAKGSTFVAVGAMHLPGGDGILRLLEEQGFTVTRLH